jgi:hypothetical protein
MPSCIIENQTKAHRAMSLTARKIAPIYRGYACPRGTFRLNLCYIEHGTILGPTEEIHDDLDYCTCSDHSLGARIPGGANRGQFDSPIASNRAHRNCFSVGDWSSIGLIQAAFRTTLLDADKFQAFKAAENR